MSCVHECSLTDLHLWFLSLGTSVMQAVISRRSDMLVMSHDGPLGAYVNAHGFVHEVLTLYRAKGLALRGPAVSEYSWFPGYGLFNLICFSGS